jgi:hypothetical protein
MLRMCAHDCAQWTRLLNVYGEWCCVHRAHLCALAALSILPLVDELDTVCTTIQQVTFVRAMCIAPQQNETWTDIKLVRVQKVRLRIFPFHVFLTLHENIFLASFSPFHISEYAR